jgi:hypothetical protein
MAARDKEKKKIDIEYILSTNKEADLTPLDLDLETLRYQ